MASTEPLSAGTEVLVVGAGPVGLTAALMLARHGTPVRIIDRSAGPTDLSKAMVVWQRTMETLNPVLPHQRFTTDHPVLHSVQLDFNRPVTVEFPSPPAGAPPCALVPQSATERILIDQLTALGVSVERNTELTSFAADPDRVDCELSTPSGPQRVRTPWLVACDGAHSTVRHSLTLNFPGETVHSRWMLADIEVAGDPQPDHHEIRINLSKGIAALFPLGGSRWRLISSLDAAAVDAGAEGELRTFSKAQVQAALDENTDFGWTVTECHWTSDFGVNERQVEQYVHGRVLLAGDAAHVHSPAGGQGMNTGIQDVANLAWKIALVERGAAPAGLLDSYQAERHPVGAAVVHQSGLMLKAGMATGAARFGRNHLAPLVLSVPVAREKLIAFLTEEAVNYRKGPLADGTGHRSGASSGDGWPLSPGAQAQLVLLGDAAGDDAPETFGGPNGFPLTVTRVAADDRIADALGATNGALLVRPDGAVASIGPDAASVLGWMSRLAEPVSLSA